jgi:hypothetical protein
VRQGVVMVKQPGLLSPKFRVTSSHVFMQSLQNIAVEPTIQFGLLGLVLHATTSAVHMVASVWNIVDTTS